MFMMNNYKVRTYFFFMLFTITTTNLFCQQDTTDTDYSVDTMIIAQDSSIQKKWNYKFNYSGLINQASFSNWVSGGQGFFAFENCINLNLDFENKNWTFINTYSQTYGMTWIQDDKFRKAQDNIEFHSKLMKKVKKNISTILFLDLFTQVSPSVINDQNIRISNFFSPAFITEGLAFEYIVDSINLGIVFSPIAAKHTIVLDPLVDGTQFGLETNNGVYHKIGLYFSFQLNKTIMERTQLTTNLFLFSNYLNFGKIDIRWNNLVSITANKWLTINLNTYLIYNQDVLFSVYDEINGVQQIIDNERKIQFSQSIGIGVNFNSK